MRPLAPALGAEKARGPGAVPLRDVVAAVLILAILGLVLGDGVSGFLQIVLAIATGLLTLFLVRSKPHAPPGSGS